MKVSHQHAKKLQITYKIFKFTKFWLEFWQTNVGIFEVLVNLFQFAARIFVFVPEDDSTRSSVQDYNIDAL